MTLKEFEAILEEKPELKNKLKEAKNKLQKVSGNAVYETMSKFVAELGYDVPASEFKLGKIQEGEMSEEELSFVTGGDGCNEANQAIQEGHCLYDYVDTDCWRYDFCDFWFVDEYHCDLINKF